MSPNAGGGGGVAGSQPTSTAVHMEPKYVNFGAELGKLTTFDLYTLGVRGAWGAGTNM